MTTNESDCIITDEKIDYKLHWNTAYQKNSTEKLGWYEEKSEQTLALISEARIPKNAAILNVGAGSSTLIDNLLQEDFTNIIANVFLKFISVRFLLTIKISSNIALQFRSHSSVG